MPRLIAADSVHGATPATRPWHTEVRVRQASAVPVCAEARSPWRERTGWLPCEMQLIFGGGGHPRSGRYDGLGVTDQSDTPKHVMASPARRCSCDGTLSPT